MKTMLINNRNTQKNSIFSPFKPYPYYNVVTQDHINLSHRNRTYSRDVSNSDKIKAFIGSTIGTAVPILLIMKKQGIKNPLKLKYGIADMIAIASGAIIGGVGLGLVGESKEIQKNRIKEGIFQFLNAAIPTWVVSGAMTLCENSKKSNTKLIKMLSVIGALMVGMHGSVALANLITDPQDKHPDRNLTPKDALANIDDGIGVLALAKIPLIEKFNISAFLPLVYTSCGYRAGKSN